MAKVYVFDHPLIQHKLTYIRDKATGTKDFRELVDEVATLMAFEITRDMPLEETEIDTPVSRTKSKILAGKKMGIIPILRAGIGMVDGILKLIPAAKVGHIGLYRDPETLKPIEYYVKLPSDAVSLDSFSVGLTLGIYGAQIVIVLACFGITATILTWLGLLIGRKVQGWLGSYSEALGGSILFAFGIKLLLG